MTPYSRTVPPDAQAQDSPADPSPAATPPDAIGARPPRRITGRSGSAVIETRTIGPVDVPFVDCSGRIDDDVFFDVYDTISAGQVRRRMFLVVDVREADMSVGYDGYARAARMLRRRGIESVMAVICDHDPGRILDAKAGQEMAAIHGLRIVQRVIGRPEDAPAVIAAWIDRDDPQARNGTDRGGREDAGARDL